MDGEAASIAAGARANDGLHAYQLLRGRYEPTSASSGLMIFFSLLTFTMTQSLEKHILQFKDKLRELAPHQNWFLNPMQVCSIFLRSLSPKYRQWVQQKMADADRDPTLLYTPELMYAQTMEWERTRLFASGEADNSGEALWVEASSKPTKSQQENNKSGRPVCRHWLNGKCTWGKQCRFRHPNQKDSKSNSEDETSSSSDDEFEEVQNESRKRKSQSKRVEQLDKKLNRQKKAH